MGVNRERWQRTWFPLVWQRWCIARTNSTGSQFIEWWEYRWSIQEPTP